MIPNEHGQQIEVQANQLGEPTALTIESSNVAVEQVLERWRIADGWWDGRSAWREYFRLTTTTGRLMIVYHDLHNQSWVLHRVFD